MKDSIVEIFLSKFNCDINLLKEYVDFCLNNSYSGEEYKEEHHILLQAHFPEIKKEIWNIVNLKYMDHVKAHELLAKVLPSDRIANMAHFFMKANCGQLDDNLRAENAKRIAGDNNPAKRDEVRDKISRSKKGKSRSDMVGTKYFGASEETIKIISDKASKFHMGTVPVRLTDGSVIKIKTDDPRYLSGELKCIIGAKKGQVGTLVDPEVNARFRDTLDKRKQKFASMTGEEIALHCVKRQAEGKVVIDGGKMATNFSRLFKFANLNPDDYIHLIKR